MKTFNIAFLSFPGLDALCKLCEEPIKKREEEIVVPVLYLDQKYQGPICETCYKNLPSRIDATNLPRYQG
jgi:hypothetical protein